MRIMIETTTPLSETDYKILSLLLDRHKAVAPEDDSPETKSAPKKAVPAPEAAPEAKETPSEAAPGAEESDQDAPVSDGLLDTAVSKAKALVQDGKKDAVKRALESAGVPRVGAIETKGQCRAFLSALEA